MRHSIFSFLLLFSLHSQAQTIAQWKDSLSYLQQQIELHPKSLELRMRKAEGNIALSQWLYAIDEYSDILQLYPTHLGALYFRAFAYHHIKKYAFARADYEQVLRYAPEHQNALTGLIITNLDDGKMNAAYDNANHLVELYKNESNSYSVRSLVEERLGKLSLAIDDISTAIDIEEKKLKPGGRLSLDNDYVQYVMQRIQLRKIEMAALKKKSDKEILNLINADKSLLMARGIPSRALR